MTLPSSGALSISQIAAEFGVSLPCVFPDAFYGKPGVASSGALILPDSFYGLSNVTFTPNGGLVTQSSYGTNCVISLMCSQSAVWTFSLPLNVTANVANGGSQSTAIFTLAVGGPGSVRNRNFAVSGTAAGVTRNFTLDMTADFS